MNCRTEGGLRRVGLEPLLLVPEPNPPLFVLRKTINESGVENARELDYSIIVGANRTYDIVAVIERRLSW